MRRALVFRRLCFLWSLLATACLCVADDDSQPALQYRLSPGDHLVYARTTAVTRLSDGHAVQRSADQIEIWCVDKSGDEATILLGLTHVVNEQATPMTGLVLYADGRGRLRLPDSSTRRAGEFPAALDVIPTLRLPVQDGSVWLTPPDLLALRRRCTLTGSDPKHDGQQRIEYVREYPDDLGTMLGRSETGQFWFDADAGLVTRTEARSEDRLGDSRTETITVLRQRGSNPSDWAVRRSAEATAFLRVLRSEDRLLEETVNQPQQIEQTLERLNRLWSGHLDTFTRRSGSPFEALTRTRCRRMADRAAALRVDAEYARRWLDHSAAPWSLPSSSGETLTSEQIRNGPVVECLWSSDDPAFLATLEAMRNLQKELAGTPIRVVCLNLDADAALARRLTEHVPAGLTHVLAESLRGVERSPHLPVVRVLDGRGVIRRMWIGWQPSYPDVAEAARRAGT